MMTVHAWFSAATALVIGSSVFRKPSGATVNVTRMSSEKEGKGHFPYDEKYLGEVVRAEDGGWVGEGQPAHERRVLAAALPAPHFVLAHGVLEPFAVRLACRCPARRGRSWRGTPGNRRAPSSTI